MTAKPSAKMAATKRQAKTRVASRASPKLDKQKMVALFRSLASEMLPASRETVASVKCILDDGRQEWVFLTEDNGSDDEGSSRLRIAHFTGPASMLPVKSRPVRRAIKAAPAAAIDEYEIVERSPSAEHDARRKMPARAARPKDLATPRQPTPGPSGTTGTFATDVQELVSSVGKVNLSARRASSDFGSESEAETEIETTRVRHQ